MPTLGTFATDNGITLSNLSAPYDLIDGDANLEGVKTADNIAVQGVDTSSSGSTSALSGGNFLSFAITIPNSVTIDLDSVSAQVAGVDIFTNGSVNGHSSRIFSSIDGTDDVLGDTISRFGFTGRSGDIPFELQTAGLSDTSGNINTGANVEGSDFRNLTDTTVTFFFPFIDNSSATSRAVIIDDLEIQASISAVPEASQVIVFSLVTGLAALRRKRKGS